MRALFAPGMLWRHRSVAGLWNEDHDGRRRMLNIGMTHAVLMSRSSVRADRQAGTAVAMMPRSDAPGVLLLTDHAQGERLKSCALRDDAVLRTRRDRAHTAPIADQVSRWPWCRWISCPTVDPSELGLRIRNPGRAHTASTSASLRADGLPNKRPSRWQPKFCRRRRRSSWRRLLAHRVDALFRIHDAIGRWPATCWCSAASGSPLRADRCRRRRVAENHHPSLYAFDGDEVAVIVRT